MSDSRLDDATRLAMVMQGLRFMNVQRKALLNDLAEGKAELTEGERVRLTRAERVIAAVVDDVDVRTARTVKVVDLSADPLSFPSSLVEVYGRLHDHVYGSGAVKSDDGVIIGLGRRQGRTSSGQTEKRGGAKGGGKKAGANTRAVIMSDRWFEYKRTVDRKLRRIASDMRAELAGEATASVMRRCIECKKVGEADWTFCPRCGAKMINDEE